MKTLNPKCTGLVGRSPRKVPEEKATNDERENFRRYLPNLTSLQAQVLCLQGE